MTYFCPNVSATLPLKHLLMITQQEKDVKAADKEDADKEDAEETKKISKKSVKSPQLISNLLKKNWVVWRMIETHPGYIVKLSAPLKKQNPTPCHQNHEYQSFLFNLKTTLFICCSPPLPCNPWLFLNPMNPIHLHLKSSNPHSKKSTNPTNPASYHSFIPFNHYDPYLWLSFLNIQPFAPTHFSLQKKIPIPSKKSIPEKQFLTCSSNQLWTPL